jgi:hypothetical protein
LAVPLKCRYEHLSTYVLGKKKGRAALLPFQLIVLLGVAITYTVVSIEPGSCTFIDLFVRLYPKGCICSQILGFWIARRCRSARGNRVSGIVQRYCKRLLWLCTCHKMRTAAAPSRLHTSVARTTSTQVKYYMFRVVLQVGGDSLRAFATFITPNLSMGRWSFYIIFGAVQLMLSMVRAGENNTVHHHSIPLSFDVCKPAVTAHADCCSCSRCSVVCASHLIESCSLHTYPS